MHEIEVAEGHLAPLPRLTNHLSEDESYLDEDSCVEITSNVDEISVVPYSYFGK